MPVYNLGALNTSALTAPDLYIQKVPPQTLYLNGVPTDILGIVGVGSWGPINSPVIAGLDTFGGQQVRKYDLTTAIAISAQNGANNIRAVRITDGTDVAATTIIKDSAGTPATGATLTAFYTGTLGNTLSASVTNGTKASTYMLTINRPGYASEVFDNIGGSGATFWANLVSAVNNGISGIRGPSVLCVASVASSVLTPNLTLNPYSFSGGTDGVTTLTDALIVGTDATLASARKGMYALRGQGCQVANLIDVVDSTQWANIAAFADSEGMYIPIQGAAGASYTTVSTSLGTAGVDTPSIKPLVGDWVYWQDTVNTVQRLIAPATFVAARQAALSPQNSVLNKQLYGPIGTQRTSQNQAYAMAEITAIAAGRMDVITNPCPGGSFYGCRTGRNASSDPTRNGDNYPRMMNYIALTLAASFGWVIGQPQTANLRTKAKAAIDAFLWTLADPTQAGGPMIGDVNGGPAYSVQLDAANNPSSRVALGYMQADVQVKFLGIVWFFLVNLEGGQTVTVKLVGTQPAK